MRDTESKPKKMPHDRRVRSSAQPKALSESGSGLEELRSYLIVHYAGVRQVEMKQLQSPFLKRFLKASGEWGEAEWADDVERRLRKVVATIDPTPQILSYKVQRLKNRVSILTSTPNEQSKQEMIALFTGQWPGWEKITRAVPELSASMIHFDDSFRRFFKVGMGKNLGR
jgi:hypothetical protein